MAQSDTVARQALLDLLGDAADHLAVALAALGAAYEQLDERQADSLEQDLFHPIQQAYGRAKRTYAGFADRYGLNVRDFTSPSSAPPSTGVKGFVEQAMDAVAATERELITLQESPMAIEVGDQELRAGVSETRRLIDGASQRSRAFVRTFGR